MCYSKEVQLITGGMILAFVLVYLWKYKRLYCKEKKTWLQPFLYTILLTFTAIGLHQIFEFLSLLTGNLIIYKIGLIFSILGMYWILRSFEVLTNKKIYSSIALIAIALLAVYIFIIPVNFEEKSFYLEHNSTFFWAAVWLVLFVYWHLCVLNWYSTIKKEEEKKTTLLYLLGLVDISFILSVIYVIGGHFLFSINVCTDAPSIWCTFFVIQTAFIPIFLNKVLKYARPKQKKTISKKEAILFFIIAGSIVILLSASLLLFKCLTWKFVFP